MSDSATGYKIIAAISLTAAALSCADQGNAVDPQLLTKLTKIESAQARIEADLVELKGCELDAFLDDECAENELPNDASVTVTYCRSQGRGLEYELSLAPGAMAEGEGGAGWDLGVIAKANVGVRLDLSLQGQFGQNFGKNVDICIDIPMTLSEGRSTRQISIRKQQIQALIRSINLDSEAALRETKYHRRLDYLLNYAAMRTYGVNPQFFPRVFDKVAAPSMPLDSFAVIDQAEDRFRQLEFNGIADIRAAFQDQSIKDITSVLDTPPAVRSILENPMQKMASFQSIDKNTFCAEMGIDPTRPICTGLEKIPDEFTPQTLVADLVELIPLPGRTAEEKEDFCSNHPGRVYDRYCGRR
jgi:hypothetical protein